jgi:hypothetical protein
MNVKLDPEEVQATSDLIELFVEGSTEVDTDSSLVAK